MTAANYTEGVAAAIRSSPDVILCDIKMPDGNGLDLLRKVRDENLPTPVIMITAHTSTEDAVEAMKRGAVDYISKPFNNDELVLVVRRALGEKLLQDENLYLRQELAGKYTFANIIGKGSRMQEIFRTIERIGKVSSTVLLTGESGTGKELIARAIHFSSIRKDRKFVSINCGALPETLLESELFGHERGAFTGAVREKRGLFQEADGGTLFLDEISETTPTMQVKLLRAIQEKLIRRVGGNDEISRRRPHHRRDQQGPDGPRRRGQVPRGPLLPDQRHPDRAAAAALPHRGHRAADHALHRRRSARSRRSRRRRSRSRRCACSRRYPWPGNVRELENTLERTVALEAGPVINASSLPEAIVLGVRTRVPDFESLPEEGINLEAYLETVGKRLMREALDRCGGVQTKAAELLHMSFRSFRYYAKKYSLVHREEMYEGEDEGPAEAKGTRREASRLSRPATCRGA